MQEIYVVDCCRTAIGKFGGALKNVPAKTLGAVVISEGLRRAGVQPEMVDEVLFGCVLTAGLGQNVARQAAVEAGIPHTVAACTVGMVCGSGMKSIIEGARSIRSGDADIVVAGGAENMSASPYLAPAARWGARMLDAILVDSVIKDGLWDAFGDYHMGMTAENICDEWGIAREELDAFSLSSQQKARRALEKNRFAGEIVPVPVKQREETVDFLVDEYPRDTSAKALAKLHPAFKKDNGRVTAGNASGINDGAAAVVLAGAEAVKKHGLKPVARLNGWGQAGVSPHIMGIGPVDATRNALEKAGLTVKDLDLVEANEAFAAQSLAVMRELGLRPEITNVNGGAIALGHPIGASGARIVVTLLHEMKKRTAGYGLATACIGGGMGVATVFELL